jgi:hypothetical protein
MCIRGKIRKRLGKLHTFSSRIVDKWNSLTEVTITAISINIFKSRLNEENWNDIIFFTYIDLYHQ